MAVEPEFKFGRKPPIKKAKLLAETFLTSVPPHPPQTNILNIGGWNILGNDQYGDCVAVTWANERRLMTRLVGKEHYPNLDDVIKLYKTQNPNFPHQDEGMVIQTALDELHKNGGPDGVKPVAFAQVNHQNLDEVKAALALFGHLWIGVTVQEANMTQFRQKQPWEYVRLSPVEGGHSIVGGGYDSDLMGGDVVFETWAEVTSFTDNFWTHLVDEAWVVIWPEHFQNKYFVENVDLEALKSGYRGLTGRELPVPNPDPQPPAPNGNLFPVSDAVAGKIRQVAGHKKVTPEAWLEHHLEKYFDLI